MLVMIHEQNMGEFPVMAVSELWAVPGLKLPGLGEFECSCVGIFGSAQST